ncbi:TPA: IS30 family transposase, partial [Enterococcus faecium]
NSLRYLEFREGAFDFQTSQQNPRKSLNYRTPLEVFLSCIDKDILSSLI